MANSVILTGASGYIGRNLVDRLQQSGMPLEILDDTQPPTQDTVSPMMDGPMLIHLAGASGRESVDTANRERAHHVARKAISLVRKRGGQFAILVSSIYATLAEDGRGGAYGAHKLEIERQFSAQFGSGLVILRLPPIYGGDRDHSSVRSLASLVRSGVPLPLGRATALRDYLAMSNLLDLLMNLTDRIKDLPAASEPRIYEPSDGEPISTMELARQLANVLRVRPRLLSVPEPAVRWILNAIGRGALGEGAFSPLRSIGNARLQTDLDWQPATSMPESLAYLER